MNDQVGEIVISAKLSLSLVLCLCSLMEMLLGLKGCPQLKVNCIQYLFV